MPEQHEGTVRPSAARCWDYAFDVRSGYDLAFACGEAIAADGRAFPARIGLTGLAGSEIDTIDVYFAPPSVSDADRWTLAYDAERRSWAVQQSPLDYSEPPGSIEAFSTRNPGVLPLTVTTFAPREIGQAYAIGIDADGQSSRLPAA